MARTRKPATSSAERSKKARAVAKRIMPASELPFRFRALIYGRSGAGKTRLAASSPNPVILDVNEEGTISTARDWDPPVFEAKFWEEITDFFWFLQEGDHGFDTVCVDGLTAMQELAIKFVLGDEYSRDASRDPDMPDRRVWGKVAELMKTQLTNYRNLPMNVVFTATDRKRFTGDEDDDDVGLSIGPALTPSVAGAAERAVSLIGYLHKRRVNIRVKKGGKTVKRQVVRRRLIIDDPTELYATKDRYYFGVPYLDAPDISTMIETLKNSGSEGGSSG